MSIGTLLVVQTNNKKEMGILVAAAVPFATEPDQPAVIARQIMSGKRSAEAYFVRQFRKPILQLLERMSGDHNLAEDIAHDTIIAVIANLREGKLEEPARLAGYTYATARNLLLAWQRKLGTHEIPGGSLDYLPKAGPTPETEYLLALDKAALRRSIETLSVPRDREILMRHYIKEQSKPEVCEALRLTSQHFDRVICRARMRLQVWMLQVAPALAIEALA